MIQKTINDLKQISAGIFYKNLDLGMIKTDHDKDVDIDDGTDGITEQLELQDEDPEW